MRFFKYLIVLVLTLFSLNASASWKIGSTIEDTPQKACSVHLSKQKLEYHSVIQDSPKLYFCYYKTSSGVKAGGESIVEYILSCPSATEKVLKVPTNTGTYTCLEQCQYRIMGCVDIPEEPGMTCNAISSGIACKSQSTADSNNSANNTGNTGSNSNNDGSTNSTNSAKSESTSTNTSTSTSNTTTTNNTTNNTSTSTTTTTTTNNTTTTTNTTIDLSSLENTINNVAKKIIDAINSKKDQDGSEDGDKDGTDLTETNKKLDDIKKSIDDGSEWAKKGEDDVLPTGEQIAIPERTLEKKSFTENMFGSAAQCPANKTLSMSLLGVKSFSYTFDFSQWCYYLGLLGQLILIGAYLQGANIITRNS